MTLIFNESEKRAVYLYADDSYKITIKENVKIDFICTHKTSLELNMEIEKNANISIYFTSIGDRNSKLDCKKNINVGVGAELFIFENLAAHDNVINNIVQDSHSKVELFHLCELKDIDEVKSIGEFTINGENCIFNQMSRFLLHDKSNGLFESIVIAKEGAKDAVIEQVHNTLLIGEHSKMRVHSSPQMKIYHDALKAKHSSTVGTLDEEVIFFMQSRAISKDDAEVMLQEAFKLELLEKIKVDEFKEIIS